MSDAMDEAELRAKVDVATNRLAERLARLSDMAAELNRQLTAGKLGPPKAAPAKDAHARMVSEIADALDDYYATLPGATDLHVLSGEALARRIRDILYGGA